MFESISWIGVGAATIAAFLLGYLWYGPLFGKRWMRELGRTIEELGSAGPALAPLLAMQFIATIITAIVLAIIIERFGPGPMTGAFVGLMCAAGFVATAKLADVLFSRRSSSTLYWIEKVSPHAPSTSSVPVLRSKRGSTRPTSRSPTRIGRT